MNFDPEAIQKQIDQHQQVIDSLEKQKQGIIDSIDQLQQEIDKLKQISGLIDSVGK